jgi:hypothetical protein
MSNAGVICSIDLTAESGNGIVLGIMHHNFGNNVA